MNNKAKTPLTINEQVAISKAKPDLKYTIVIERRAYPYPFAEIKVKGTASAKREAIKLAKKELESTCREDHANLFGTEFSAFVRDEQTGKIWKRIAIWEGCAEGRRRTMGYRWQEWVEVDFMPNFNF